jgi:hypothetical protein
VNSELAMTTMLSPDHSPSDRDLSPERTTGLAWLTSSGCATQLLRCGGLWLACFHTCVQSARRRGISVVSDTSIYVDQSEELNVRLSVG